MRLVLAALVTGSFSLSCASAKPARVLQKQVEVEAPAADVWSAWTTAEGARSFFAPDARIEARPGGAYEIYFALEMPEGKRGSEGCKVVAVDTGKRLAFTWNFPLSLPEIRDEHTEVAIALEPLGEKRTRVTLTATGWKPGEVWDKGYAYFEKAWDTVLTRLQSRFKAGPVDWSKL